jgi:hypothetical protein
LQGSIGDNVPPHIRAQLDAARDPDFFTDLKPFSRFVARAKNTMFGFDAGLAGVQLAAALIGGGPLLLAGAINRTLAMLHMPHIQTVLLQQGGATRKTQFLADHLHYGGGGTAFTEGEGTLIRYGNNIKGVGKVSKPVDSVLTEVADGLAHLQFNVILSYVREMMHEGNLALLELAHRFEAKALKAAGSSAQPRLKGITDVPTRQLSARWANTLTAFAPQALKRGRAEAERVLLTSAPMTRAQIDIVAQVAKGMTPGSGATAAERLTAAMAIGTYASSVLMMGKLINDHVGVGEFIFDPSAPGFGLITLPSGQVLNLFSQQSFKRAIFRSFRELAEGDIDEAGLAWAKFAGGRSSVVGDVLTRGAVNFGFVDEKGFGFGAGAETGLGQLADIAPIPPLVRSTALQGETSAGQILAEGAGVSSFEEREFVAENREIDAAFAEGQRTNAVFGAETLDELKDMIGSNRTDTLLDEFGAESLAAARAATQAATKEAADGGDPVARALMVGFETQERLNSLALEPGLTKRDYRKKSGDIKAQQRGRLRDPQIQEVFDGFEESESRIDQLTNQWFDLFQQALGPGELTDFDLFNELEDAFIGRIGDEDFQLVMANVNALDPKANAFERELRQVRGTLATTGFFDIDADAWAQTQQLFASDNLGRFRTAADFRDHQLAIEIEARFGVTDIQAEVDKNEQFLLQVDKARDAVSEQPVFKQNSAFAAAGRDAFIRRGPAERSAYLQAFEWGYFPDIPNAVNLFLQSFPPVEGAPPIPPIPQQ